MKKEKNMFSEKMISALNKQVQEEMFSAYLYQSMAAHFASESLNGMANWFSIQAKEEMTHAFKLYDFIIERGGKVKLMEIKEPQHSWDTPLAAFEAALGHEKHITECFNNLMDLAMDEKDHATRIFLEWFVSEQVEEEASASEVVDKIKMNGSHNQGLMMIDKELAQRVFTAPVDSE